MDVEPLTSDVVESREWVGSAARPRSYLLNPDSWRSIEEAFWEMGAETGTRQPASGAHKLSGLLRKDAGARGYYLLCQREWSSGSLWKKLVEVA
jgi:hypothetical protein